MSFDIYEIAVFMCVYILLMFIHTSVFNIMAYNSG